MTPEQRASFAIEWSKWRDDPDRFNEVALRRAPYWGRQKEVCQSIVEYRSTVVYSGNAVGKSFLIAGIILWWLYTRPWSLVICTAASQASIGSILWKELRRAVESSCLPTPRLSMGIKASPAVIEITPGWHGLGYSTTTCERASGQHAKDLLVVCDEASSIEPQINEALESLNYSRALFTLNPIRADGPAIDLIRQADRDRRDGIPHERAVNAIRIASTESPHATWDRSPFGLADRIWLASMARRYGVTSLIYKSHVLAEIPTLSAEQLLPDAWLDWAASQTRPAVPINHPIHATRRLSCDLSEGVGRDSTCVLVRDDWGILEIVVSNTIGLPEAAALMARLGQKWDIPPGRMSYDVLGVGRSMRNHLVRHGIEAAVPYAGEASSLDPSFTNLRTEAAWKLRNRLDPQFVADTRSPHRREYAYAIPTHAWYQRLRDEVKPLTYELKGRETKLLSKKDWVEVLGFSPDIADAWIQSHAF